MINKTTICLVTIFLLVTLLLHGMEEQDQESDLSFDFYRAQLAGQQFAIPTGQPDAQQDPCIKQVINESHAQDEAWCAQWEESLSRETPLIERLPSPVDLPAAREHDSQEDEEKDYAPVKRKKTPVKRKKHKLTLPSKPSLRCKWQGCTERCATITNLAAHTKIHVSQLAAAVASCAGYKAPLKCQWQGCTQQCTKGDTLTIHMRTHTGEQPFQCSICEKRFSQAANRNRHENQHTRKRIFECTICGHEALRADTLKQHVAKHSEDWPSD